MRAVTLRLSMAFLVGALFFWIWSGGVVVTLVPWRLGNVFSAPFSGKRLSITLYLAHHDRIAPSLQKPSVIWKDDGLFNVKNVVHVWFDGMYEEHLVDRRPSLEGVSKSLDGQDLYLSFDNALFPEHWPIYRKQLFIEALLRTLSHASFSFLRVMFLAGHQQMQDVHIDFSEGFPLGGFAVS